MTHDRLCPCFGGIGPEHWPDTRICQCDLIAKVRADANRTPHKAQLTATGWSITRQDGDPGALTAP